MDAIRGRRVVVTGASGFIGEHLVANLKTSGADVRAVSLRVEGWRDAVNEAAPEVVFHLAGFSEIGASWTEPGVCFAANVNRTLELLEVLRETPCRRMVLASTADVYGDAPAPFREDGPVNPLSPYAVSKWGAERMCEFAARAGAPPVVALRLFNAYGPGQPSNRLVPDVILTALRGEDVAMTEGRQRKEANYVADIAEGIALAAEADGVEGEVINLGSGNALSVREVAETILGLMGNPVVAHFGMKPERPVEVPVVEADPAKAQRLLGWQPRHSLIDGLTATISSYKALKVAADEF